MTSRRAHLLALAFYALVAVIITYPLVTVMGTRFAGFGYSDAYEMAHHIWWFKHALQTGQPLFDGMMMGYPDGIEGITLWAHPLQFFPAWLLAFVLPLPVTYNLMLLVSITLNGWAMYWLARHLVDSSFTEQTSNSTPPPSLWGLGGGGARNFLPALLAGLVFMAFPTMQGHLGAGHAGLMVQYPVPLYVFALFRLKETRDQKWIALSAVLFFLSITGHTLQLIYVLLPITALFWLALLVNRDWRSLAGVTVTAMIGAMTVGLFLIPIARTTLGTAAYTDAGGAVRYSADLLALVTPSFFHPIYGQFEYTHRVLGINIDEGYAYGGVVVMLLGALAVWKRREARWWLLLALVVYVLSLGPVLKLFDQPVRVTISEYETLIPLPGALPDTAPLFNLARTPGRYNFVLGMAMAALAGYGFAWLVQRLKRGRWLVFGILCAVILFDYHAFWSPQGTPELPTTSADVPNVLYDLRERDDLRAVLDVPFDNFVAAKQGLYLQTAHEHPLIAGQVTRGTPVSPAKLTLLQTTLDPALLREAGADVVIIHREYDADGRLMERAREQLGAPLHDDPRFAVFLTPDADDAPAFAALPFDGGEVTVSADTYLYAPESGWTTFSAALEADTRYVALLLDGVEIQAWNVDGDTHIDVPLPLTPGYHTVTLALDPPCPAITNEALRCKSLTIRELALSDFAPGDLAAVAYGRGVTLGAARVDAPDDGTLVVSLWWQFFEALTEADIRFVHVMNENGELVAQSDVTLGAMRPGSQRVESIMLTLPTDLPTGTYRVYTGWYSYPQNERFPVVSEVEGRENGFALISTFERE